MELQNIYLKKISESLARISACESFLAAYTRSNDIYSLEASVLQVRKAFECVAFAAIAPNKIAYEQFRIKAEEPADYRKDFNARKIIQLLSAVNKDFYPTPLLPAIQQANKQWHFERKTDGFLTKNKFESFYDRLGKFLHADNPWGNDKGTQNLVADLPSVLNQLLGLIELHYTVIRTPEFNGVWVIEASATGSAPRVICGQADGEFVIEKTANKSLQRTAKNAAADFGRYGEMNENHPNSIRSYN